MGYDIDDILKEVQKRREENENEIKQSSDLSFLDKEKPEPVVEDIEPKENDEVEESIDVFSGVEEEKQEEESIDINELVDVSAPVENKPTENDEYFEVDVKAEKKREGKTKKGKKNKIIKAIIAIILVLLIAGGVGTWAYINKALNKVSENDKKQNTQAEDVWTGMDKLVESFDPIYEAEASEISSLQDMIEQWYKNGKPCSSTHVLNIMLIGEDTRGSEILDDGTRADSAIIASINTDTKKIKLTSILRDTYAYWQTTQGDDSTEHFNKINGAMSTGDVNTYITAVENLYKVKIDNYVIVNFDSFEKIVDILGGVDIEMTSAEINEINSHQKRYGHVTIDKTFDGKKGVLKLNGKQALAYCRIRKLDSDNMRANRQKICLSKIFEGMKGASNVQLLKILNSIVPYVKTDMPKNNIVKVAKYALKQGWMTYDISMSNLPDSRINERGAGGMFYGTWCWKSDFPQDAYNLQMDIYGKSSITLAHKRVDVLKCPEKGFRSQGYSPVWATITNEHYGEATTTTTEATTEQ